MNNWMNKTMVDGKWKLFVRVTVLLKYHDENISHFTLNEVIDRLLREFG